MILLNRISFSCQTKAVPDNRRQAESLSLSREVCWSRAPQAIGPPQHRPLLHSASGPHTDLDSEATAASAKLTKLQELQDKKQTMDKILLELHSLRDQTLNNSSCECHWKAFITLLFLVLNCWATCGLLAGRGFSTQCSLNMEETSDCPALCTNGASASTSFHPALTQHQDGSSSKEKLR